jgi:hypothetical protein
MIVLEELLGRLKISKRVKKIQKSEINANFNLNSHFSRKFRFFFFRTSSTKASRVNHSNYLITETLQTPFYSPLQLSALSRKFFYFSVIRRIARELPRKKFLSLS